MGNTEAVARLGYLVPLTCPDCGGSLWEVNQGHAFTADALLLSTQETLEETLWVALRVMEERKNLLSTMAVRAEGAYSVQQAERLEEITKHINRLRKFLLNGSNGHNTSNGASSEG